MARESLGSTGIGDGIAIPHVRNPIVMHIPRPTITLCFLEHPIDFGALDGQPVHTLFTIVSPTVRAHLHLLLPPGLRAARQPVAAACSRGRLAARRSCDWPSERTVEAPSDAAAGSVGDRLPASRDSAC